MPFVGIADEVVEFFFAVVFGDDEENVGTDIFCVGEREEEECEEKERFHLKGGMFEGCFTRGL